MKKWKGELDINSGRGGGTGKKELVERGLGPFRVPEEEGASPLNEEGASPLKGAGNHRKCNCSCNGRLEVQVDRIDGPAVWVDRPRWILGNLLTQPAAL